MGGRGGGGREGVKSEESLICFLASVVPSQKCVYQPSTLSISDTRALP